MAEAKHARSAGGRAVDKWLKLNKSTQAKLASTVGVVPVALWRWMVGINAPRIEYAAKIERITGIPSNIWAKGRG